MRTPTVHVSIVIGSDETLVFGCLDSVLAGTTGAAPRITVTANPATQDTVTAIRARYADVKIVQNASRSGFAANHNRVIRESSCDYVLVLNDDTVLHPGAIDESAGYLDAHDDVAVVGARLLNADGSYQNCVYARPRMWQTLAVFAGKLFPALRGRAAERVYRRAYKGRDDAAEASEPRLVHSVKGAFMLVRRTAVERAGYMDEVTDVYEEVEWQHRFGQCGYRVAYVPSAVVTHFGGVTIGAFDRAMVNQVKAALNFYEKHGGRFRWLVFRSTMAGLLILRRLAASRHAASAPHMREAVTCVLHPSTWIGAGRRWHCRDH